MLRYGFHVPVSFARTSTPRLPASSAVGDTNSTRTNRIRADPVGAGSPLIAPPAFRFVGAPEGLCLGLFATHHRLALQDPCRVETTRPANNSVDNKAI